MQNISCPTCHVCTPGFTSPSAHDNCDLNPRISYVDDTIPGKCINAYTITRTWTAKDACGNTSKPVTQTITVGDTVPPTIGGQGPNATIACGQTPVFTPPTAKDNCDKNPSIDSFSSTTTKGCTITYTRSWYAVDACGNVSDTVSQTITTTDNVAPTVSGGGANATIQCTQTPAFTSPTASDNCDQNPSIDSFDAHGGTHCGFNLYP